MGLNYEAVLWNKEKKRYDKTILLFVVIYLALFVSLTVVFNSNTSIETLIIRSFGSLAILMLHVILAIGPLARLDSRFLPLLYNRRHLGVIMFLVSLVHGAFSIIQFHALGDIDPISSILTSNLDYATVSNFPFQVLGLFALIILFLMAATSHDFWLKNLGAKTWKALHMLVYLAYAATILHVFLGAFQHDTSVLSIGLLAFGFVFIAGLHLRTAFAKGTAGPTEVQDEWHLVCEVDDIEEDRAKLFTHEDTCIAVFKYDGKLSAVDNVCKHQGGPLAEGKIIDGCITCPWHGYQYLPGNGQSPPPFKDKLHTYHLKVVESKVYIDPRPQPEGTAIEPIISVP